MLCIVSLASFLVLLSCVSICEIVRINNSALANNSPFSHEWNFGINVNHLCYDVDPVQRNRKEQWYWTEGKHLAKESQRCIRMCPSAGAEPATPYITMMKHLDQSRANPSFINVTADAVTEKGFPSPCYPGRERNTSQHSLTSHTATPSLLSQMKKESTARQSGHGHTNTTAVLLSGLSGRVRH